MKKLIMLCLFLGGSFSQAALDSEPVVYLCDGLECLSLYTTSGPTLLIADQQTVQSDESMLQLADEVTGEVDSTEMIDKMAAHFETTAHEVVSAASDLLAREEGLSFEGLSQELQ